MKILYVGHYKENSGWSKAAIDLIQAIDSAGIDVVCRNIKLTPSSYHIPNKIHELESKDLNNVDVCIQHLLPHHLVSTSKFKKNIAYYVGESTTLKYNTWKTILNCMDEIWVPNQTQLHHMRNDGFANLQYIPHAFDLSKYTKDNGIKINFGDKNETFKFYYIADLNERKNIESIIKCFHSEFHRHEPVSLILKVKKFGVHPEKLRENIQNVCNGIKKTLRIYPEIQDYHQEIIITEDMSSDEIDSLHTSCDCMINATHGEGWSIPSFEAMCFGKTPICSNEGGPKEYISNTNVGTLISGTYGVCDHSDSAFPNIFTGRESWFVPNESEIKSAMRFYYENKHNINRKAGLEAAQKFSYNNVGNKIKELLHVE